MVKSVLKDTTIFSAPPSISGVARSDRGFTLIELSIVLVIIGLIVGGVLMGQDMIKAAQVRATLTQVEKYNTAVNTFREKYGALPGDLIAAAATQFGFAPRGSYAGEGDGNGLVEGVSSNAAGQNSGTLEATGETAMFWVDLSAAHLIDDSFNTASATVPPASNVTQSSTPSLNAFLPSAKLGQGNYIYVYSYSSANYYGLSSVASIYSNGIMPNNLYGSITPNQAYAIDSKIDDGLPLTGRVLGQFVNCCGTPGSGGYLPNSNSVPRAAYESDASQGMDPFFGSCYDNGGVGGVQPTYSRQKNFGSAMACELSFQFQ